MLMCCGEVETTRKDSRGSGGAGYEWFVDNWTTISISLDVVSFGSEMIVKFATNGDNLSSFMRSQGKARAADEIDNITEEAKAMLEYVGDIGTSFSKVDVLINNLNGELRNFATNFKLAGKVETLPNGTTLVLKADNGDVLGRIVNAKLEISNEQILKIQKGYRPNPKLYRNETDITSHLLDFENGASYLVPKDVLDKFGRDVLGWPDNAQFVMPKAQMDDLLSKTGGDVNKICTELGIEPSDWAGRELVRIDIANPKDLNLRMASGNEMGANELWIPGGKLPTGYPEAVINNIPKGKYIENGL